MDSTALFGTIHGSYYTISANFYLYLQYYQQKIFNFSKISGSQTDDKYYLHYITLTTKVCTWHAKVLYKESLIVVCVWGYLFGFSAQSQTKSFIHFGLPDLKYAWCLKIHFDFRCYSRGMHYS